MTPTEIRAQLERLSPEIPWAHMFEFAPGIFSVTEDNEKFYKKAVGLKRIGELLLQITEMQVHGHCLTGKRVLDLACGEGAHSIEFARKGASVTAIEGRQLYVDRARFAARVMGHPDITFVHADVRKLDPGLGSFDVVVFSGILHHLGIDDFDAMITELSRLTDDLLLIYTHVGSDLAVKNHRLIGPKQTQRGWEGYLFREHVDGATAKQREEQVRASLDNTFSFWACEESLVNALRAAGFPLILKVLTPHPFGWGNASYRPVMVAKKGG